MINQGNVIAPNFFNKLFGFLTLIETRWVRVVSGSFMLIVDGCRTFLEIPREFPFTYMVNADAADKHESWNWQRLKIIQLPCPEAYA